MTGHLSEELARLVDWRLARALNIPDPAKGLEAARRLAAELEADHPDVARSLTEGLEDMFTVRRLGIDGRLALTLTSTKSIVDDLGGSLRGPGETVEGGSIKKGWTATGMLEAERSLRRVKGCQEISTLVAALRRHIRSGDVAPSRFQVFSCRAEALDRMVEVELLASVRHGRNREHEGVALCDGRRWECCWFFFS